MTDLTPETIANLRESQRPMEQEFAVVIAALLAGRCDGKQAVASATAIHVREATRLRAELVEARAVANDLADHGLRFDLNPTMPFDAGLVNWLNYIARMDERARGIGAQLRAALAPATQREEGE